MLARTCCALMALLLVCPDAQALDLRRSHVWKAADGSGLPKLGLVHRNPDRRTMSFEHFYVSCAKAGAATIEAWPFASTGRSEKDGAAGLTTDGARHVMPGWRTAWDDMNEATMISVRSRDLSPLRAMVGATSLRFAADGFEILLPSATPAVAEFVRRCRNHSAA